MYFFILNWGHFLIPFQEIGSGEGEKETDKQTNIGVGEKHWLVASHMWPELGSKLHPRYVLWPAVEPETFWCTGWYSNHWVTRLVPLSGFSIRINLALLNELIIFIFSILENRFSNTRSIKTCNLIESTWRTVQARCLH